MSPPRHARPVAHTRRALPAHARPTKPSALKRDHSSNQISQGTKQSAGWSKSAGQTSSAVDTDDEDMAALPHYCATCEKQIITPGHLILYCSESCRRKDGNKPLSHASTNIDSPLTSPYGSSANLQSQADILPQRSPTMVRPPSITFSDSSDSSYLDMRPHYGRTESEAARYLSQFQSPNASPERTRHRPEYERPPVSVSHSNMPSLSHTPGSYMSHASSYSSTRRLPARSNPYGASSCPKSVDLVTPLSGMPSLPTSARMDQDNSSLRSSASTGTAFRVVEAELSYDKQSYVSSVSPSRGSLKQLFSHDAMKANPRPPLRYSGKGTASTDDADGR